MRRIRTFFQTSVWFLAIIMLKLSPVSASQDRSTIHQAVLDNGLQAIWEEDHRQPLVAIEVRIKGGLRGEGRYVGTGITHFIEHLLFKGTPSRPSGTIEQEVRRYGGTINAFTSFDTTGVTLFVDSKYLKEALAMLADILQNAVFDQKEFEKERAVVISEIQMNMDNPDRRLSQQFWSRHFLEHPYRHPILGYQMLLEQLTVKDVASFYAAEYQPQNITLACEGDLDPSAFYETVKEVFGGWKRGAGDVTQQLVPQEPRSVGTKETVVELPVQSAYVMLGFSSVRMFDPDVYTLDVLASIIGRGESSRLYEELVHKQQLAYEVAAWNYTPYDPGIFGIQLRTDPEKIDSAIQSVLATLQEVKEQGVTGEELEKAKRQVSADYLFSLQTVESKAADLANAMSSTGDPLFSRRYVERVAAVTASDVQKAASYYLDASTLTKAVIRPVQKTDKTSPAAGPSVAVTTAKKKLSNGATLVLGVDHALPIAAVVVAFRGGVRVETEKTQGLSNLVAQMLTKGTSKKDASQIARQVESWGGGLDSFSGRDGFGLSLQVLSDNLGDGLALVHELVTDSAFEEKELSIQRQLIIKNLLSKDDEIFDVGGRLLRKTLFGQHPYRFYPLGDKQTIGHLTRQDCQAFLGRWVNPSSMVIAVFGDIDPEAVAKQVDRSFGLMKAQSSPWPASLPEEPLKKAEDVTQTLEREQALILLGFRGSTYASNDRDALDVMTAVLSGMAGRLFQSVREKYGLSYTLGAVHNPGWDPGSLTVYAATKPEEKAKVSQVLDEQLELVLKEGFHEEEVAQAKRYLIGLHRMDLQHLGGLTKRSVLDELYGMGFDSWRDYESRINAITAPQVSVAARHYLTMQNRARVTVSSNGHAH